MLEDLHGVELEGVVEDGIEDENAPGLHVGDGLERLNGEASGHAADELVASDGPDGIARGFRLLDGQRELEAPFEHHLEDDIHIGAIGLDHVEEELTGLGLLNAGLIELEHTEADVGKLLGSLAKLELTVGFLELGFDFVACAANASFAYVAESLIPVLVGVAFRVTRLWKLDKDKLIAIQAGPDGRIAKAARLVADFLESPPESPSPADLSLLREMALMTAPYTDAGTDARKRRRRASGPKSSK